MEEAALALGIRSTPVRTGRYAGLIWAAAAVIAAITAGTVYLQARTGGGVGAIALSMAARRDRRGDRVRRARRCPHRHARGVPRALRERRTAAPRPPRPHRPAIDVVGEAADDDSVFAAMRAGARGYLLKGAEQDEVLRAIRAVASGEAIFGPAIAQRLVAYFAAGAVATQPFPELTEREREVLTRIARGKNNAAIAADLVLSLKTVQNHVSNVFTKLRVAGATLTVSRRGSPGRRAASG